MKSFTQAVETALTELSDGKVPQVLRALAGHAARIIATRPDGTVDLATVDEAIGGAGGLSRRPVLVGLPGVRLDLKGGDDVRLVFEGGSPTGAEVGAFEQDRAADKPLAFVTSKVKIYAQVMTGSAPGVPGVPIPPGPNAFALIPVIDGIPRPDLAVRIKPGEVSDPQTNAPLIQSIELQGEVTTGSEEISLR